MTHDTSDRAISQVDIDRFARASGGTGLIHTDPEYARRTSYGATLVQGIYLFALIEGRLTERHPDWIERGVLDVTFVGPVTADSSVHIAITDDPDDAGHLHVRASTPDGEAVTGHAWLRGDPHPQSA